MNIEKRKLTEEQTSNKKLKNDDLREDLHNLKIGRFTNNFHGDMNKFSLLIKAAYRANKDKNNVL